MINNLKKQQDLESLILLYQKAVILNNKLKINEYYNLIKKIYAPLDYYNVWYQKYNYLYDTKEDFIQDYLCVFHISLKSWRPRDKRKENKYSGSGEFKNFFWSALQNNYINKIKLEAAYKRNVSLRCPICEKWVNSLSTHIRNEHSDLLWDKISLDTVDFNTLSSCFLCDSYKISKNLTPEQKKAKLKKHILAMHSSYLYDRFKELYPECKLNKKEASLLSNKYEDDDSEEFDVLDKYQTDKKIGDLLNCNLSDIQMQIIENVLNKSSKKKINIVYNKNIYNCTQEEFNKELEDLQTKMIFIYNLNVDE